MVANQMAKNKVVAKMVLTREVVKVSFTQGGRKATVLATVYEDRQVGLSGLRWE